MGYRVLYDNQLLFDPYTDDRITDTKLSNKLNAAAYFDFTIAPTHSLYSKLAERAGEVRIYFNNLILYKGEITKIDEDFEGNDQVSCTGVLDYLTATRVRPYSTVEGEQPLKAPSSFDGYFQWLIDQHNSNCLDSRKRFSVGVNQGNMLDKNNYIYRASEQRPTTASEIEDKILNSSGGYLFVRYQDDLNILDLYADVHDANTQIIDYGVNILDFTKTTTAEDQYTAVVVTGYTPDPPEGQTDVKMKPITLEGCKDGGTPYSSTIVKMGDRVYDIDAVNRYGYREYYVSNTDIKTYDGLLEYACKTLNTLLSPALTISVRAVDLALIMGDKYKHLQLGQAVRIRSKPRKVDEYLMVNSIDLDLLNPENTVFVLGASYDTLTGQQSAYLKALNSSINASLDTVASLGDNVKNSAKLAQEAKDTANSATEAANKASNKADSATSVANNASSKADQATETANSASSKADTANKTANAASSKADTANDTANKADAKADQAIDSAGAANDKANSASSKADDAVKKAEQTQENIKVVQKSVDAANEAASNAQTSADAASTAASAAQATADTAKANASKAQTAADAAQSSANAANSAASKAQKSAEAANSAIADTNKEVGTINSTITQIKKDAADTRDELSGQIETVKNTMTTDYAKKTELSETEGTLRSEIETSAAGIKSEVSQKYTTKTELSKTNENVSKAQNTADKAAAAAASNASDLTEAIKTIGKTTDDLQSQIDGSIQTWFEDGEPNNLNYPAIDWTTDTIKKNHLGDLYYDNTTGYGYRWQVDQNGSYSWKRIVDTDVTKALQDAAKAQGTANSKRRIFVTTPVPPYDVADLWVQGTTGDIMRCQTAKGEGQTYAAADWIKASKYTDDTAVTKLAETVSVTYATKTTVNQLSDRIEQTVESVETVSASASAAQAAADKANAAASAAQSTADTAKANAATAQTSADTAKSAAAAAQTAADNAKSAADTAQSAADTANADLATAKKNLEAVQSQADATDEQVAAAKAAVVKAQGAADKANAAAATAKSAADTAQATADTAKEKAGNAQSTADTAKSNASKAQSTADTAVANAKKAQDDVDAVKNRVTAAETSIKQNSTQIELRATKTEVTNAINDISVGGRNYVLDSGGVSYASGKIDNTYQKLGNNTVKLSITSNSDSIKYDVIAYRLTVTDLSEYLGKNLVISAWIYRDSNQPYYGYEFRVIYTHNGSYVYAGLNYDYPHNVPSNLNVGWNRLYGVFTIPEDSTRVEFDISTFAVNTSSNIWISSPKLEIGNKPTDWSPAPEDAASDATTKADNALASSKTYTDAQLKITSDGITSTVSKTYATKSDLSTTNSNVTRAQETADSATTAAANAQKTVNDVKTDLATNYTTTTDMRSEIQQSAEGITSTVSKAYATKTELSTTNSNVAAAKKAADAAQSTANTGVANAKKAQDTADGVKADLKANYTTTTDMESKISQSAEGITSTVSKTYATKSELSTTNTNVSKAQSTADSGVSKADAAQSTANRASTAASNAQKTADTATTNAATAQSDVDKLKTDIPNTYATKSSLTQTAEDITAKVETAQSTADGAVTAASKAQQTANSISTTLSKNYTTTADADKKYATQSSLTQTANTLTSKISSVETATTKAQSDATVAIGTATQAQTDTNALKTRMSTAETKITQNTDAIALRATKTEVTNAINNINIGGRNLLLGSSFNGLREVDNTYQKFKNNSVKLVCDNTAGTSTKYVGISALKESWVLSDVVGRTLTISMWIYIEEIGQCNGYEFRIVYTDNGSTHWFDPDWTYPCYIPSANELEQGWNYVYGSFTIPITATEARFSFTCFAVPGEISIAWFSSPKAEIGNKPTTWTPAPDDTLNEAKTYTDAQLKISSDSITSTVSSVRTIAETAKSTADTAQSTAATATTTANTAKSTADGAKKAADSASSTASAAASNASSALSKAGTAETNASSAKTTAEAANKTANTAKSTADAASINASSALSKAGTAETNASSAKTTAEAANKTASEAKTTASTASSNASSALTKATSAASDASTAKSDAASAKSTANTAKNTANTAKSTADTARNELSNLKIGGENLVSNIASNWTAGNWKIPDVGSPTAITAYAGRVAHTSYVSIEPNTDYWIKVYSTKAGINALFRVLDSDKNYLSSITGLTNQKLTSPANAYYLAVGLAASVAVTLDDIQNGAVKVKLEKGNRSTDYSPSSADLSQIASEEAGTAQSTADALAEKVTKEYATKTQLEQTSTSLTSRIQTTETTVAGMSTTVKNVDDYMTFARESGQPTMTIGSSSSSFRTKLTNTSEKFMQGDQTIMELDGITSTVKASRVQMGHYQWRDTGTSMQLVYIP